jgi:hypothetical protein
MNLISRGENPEKVHNKEECGDVVKNTEKCATIQKNLTKVYVDLFKNPIKETPASIVHDNIYTLLKDFTADESTMTINKNQIGKDLTDLDVKKTLKSKGFIYGIENTNEPSVQNILKNQFVLIKQMTGNYFRQQDDADVLNKPPICIHPLPASPGGRSWTPAGKKEIGPSLQTIPDSIYLDSLSKNRMHLE